MAKRFLLSGYFGFKNFGDEEILSLLIQKLQQAQHRITVISSDPKFTKSQYKDIKSIYTFNFNEILSAIAKADVIVSGGGSLLQDATSLKSLFYYLFIIFTALIFGKKVIIFAQGIGPIDNNFGEFCTRVILKHCSYISVRDEKSYELLKSWGINAELVCDPIFSLNVQNKEEKKEVVAVQLRDFPTMSEKFITDLSNKVCENFSDKKIEIYSFQDSIDYDVCKKFENKLHEINPDIKTTIYSGLTNTQITENISKAQYLIGMRFHSIIIGLLAKCKILTINYDIKVGKIAKEFDLPSLQLKKEITNQFETLKNEQPEKIYEKVKTKKFNWSGFINAIK
ncbi:polysaccharide pyruvyl transferase CsaB [bacterium]|nr:polysaccharide pyruvyl transferase CsaB [bacterium]